MYLTKNPLNNRRPEAVFKSFLYPRGWHSTAPTLQSVNLHVVVQRQRLPMCALRRSSGWWAQGTTLSLSPLDFFLWPEAAAQSLAQSPGRRARLGTAATGVPFMNNGQKAHHQSERSSTQAQRVSCSAMWKQPHKQLWRNDSGQHTRGWFSALPPLLGPNRYK